MFQIHFMLFSYFKRQNYHHKLAQNIQQQQKQVNEQVKLINIVIIIERGSEHNTHGRGIWRYYTVADYS